MGYIRKGLLCVMLLLPTTSIVTAAEQPDQGRAEAVTPHGQVAGETPKNGGVSSVSADKERIGSLLRQGRTSLVHMEYDAALESFMEAHRLDPQDKNAIHSVMAVHIRKGNYAEAVSFLEKAASGLDSAADRKEVFEIIALVYFKRAQKDDKAGKAAEAEVSLRKAVNLDPDSPQYLIALARMRHRAGNFREAEQMLIQGFERLTDEPSRREIASAMEKMRLNEQILRKIR